MLGNLLSQLKWLISVVVYGDANLLLAQYRDYKSKVPQNVSEVHSKMQKCLTYVSKYRLRCYIYLYHLLNCSA